MWRFVPGISIVGLQLGRHSNLPMVDKQWHLSCQCSAPYIALTSHSTVQVLKPPQVYSYSQEFRIKIETFQGTSAAPEQDLYIDVTSRQYVTATTEVRSKPTMNMSALVKRTNIFIVITCEVKPTRKYVNSQCLCMT